MNLSKLVKDDVGLFESLLDDVFVNFNKKSIPNKEVQTAVINVIDEFNLIRLNKNKVTDPDPWLTKINQLYDTNCVRHSIMLVGPTGSGKSVIIEVLKKALSDIAKNKGEKDMWKTEKLNPRSITQDQL